MEQGWRQITGLDKVLEFFDQVDEAGKSNRLKASRAKVIRRVETTSSDKSYEDAGERRSSGQYPAGVVIKNGKLIGLGIHILNADVYPLQSFEIYLRSCDLTGSLDISECRDMIFLDLYHNRIEEIKLGELPAMRILGLQDNRIEALDPTGLSACQGIDAGKNRLRRIDVSRNLELVELYVNDNELEEIDLSNNTKLKYFYCHNNRIIRFDSTNNPLLRHLNATGNPMKEIRTLAPQREGRLPLCLTAGEGGCVGLRFNPVYNAQWKETGEWEQVYYAYPDEGKRFLGWFDESGMMLSSEAVWADAYGTSRVLRAEFETIKNL